MKKLYTLLSLLCLLVAVPASAEESSTAITTGYYYIVNAANSRRLTETSGNGLFGIKPTSGATMINYASVWHVVLDETTSTYTIQNLSTGNYVQAQESKNANYVTGSSAYGFGLVDYSSYYCIRNAVSSEASLGLHCNDDSNTSVAQQKVVAYNGTGPRNGWTFEALSLTDDQINYEAKGIYTGRSGIYKLTAAVQTGVLKENTSGQLVWEAASTSTDPEYLALWRLTETSQKGYYYVQNVGTTNYVQPQTTNNSQYTTAAGAPAAFYLHFNFESDGSVYWNIANDAALSESLNAQTNTGKVVAWNSVSSGSGRSNAEWTLTAVELTDKQISEAETTYGGNARFDGWYTFTHHYNGLHLYDNPTSSDGKTLRLHTGDDTDYTQLWYVSGTLGSGVTIKNAKTMRYVSTFNTTGTSAATIYPSKYVVNGTTYYAFNFSQTESIYMHCAQTGGTDYNLVQAGTGDASGSQFLLTKQSPTDAEIIAARADYLGYSVPQDGKYFQIYNPHNSTYLAVTGMSGELQHVGLLTKDYLPYSQYWQLVANGSGYKLKNVYTSLYVDNTLSGSRYTTSSDGDVFYITANSSMDLMPYFNIKTWTGASQGLHGQTSGGTVVSWAISTDGSISASEWIFKEVTLTDDEIAEAQSEYSSVKDLINNASTYTTTLLTFFTDNTCSELKTTYQAMSDDDLTTAMTEASLPTVFSTMAVKIKNAAWTNKYEERFRIATYEPYSDPATWAGTLGGYTFTYYEQPTGVYANVNDLIYVYVEQAALSNSTLQLRILPPDASSGSDNNGLHAGLNIIRAKEAGNAFISYHCTTADGGTMLSAYPNIKIHIEGGTLNGYFDARAASTTDPRRGMTNADWVEMQKLGLFSCTALNMRSEKVMFSMNSSFVKSSNATTMRDNLAVWDSLLTWEDDLWGANDKYWPNFSKYCNNIYGAHTITSSYMYASTYGTNYNRSYKGMGGVLNLNNGGAIWGPAHENGHCRQNLINIIGDTEVSNNLFSNMCVWKRGYTVTRGNPITEALTAFNGSKYYLDYGDVRIRMYLQLYLYYEVAGHHPGFYPELFKALRADPMTRKAGSDNTNYSSDNLLKFALKCCEVSGDDLTEFFQAWGFFVPVTRRYVDDYANYWVTTTDDEIATVKAKMAKYKKGAENLIFIEDRIERSAAEYPGAASTATRSDFDSQAAVGKCGDVGSFLDYKTTANTKASGYLYTVSDTTVTISSSADGAVGYKVYDADGKLVALYNTNTFKLSSAIASGNYKIVAAQADGTDVEVPNSATDTYYTLNVYYGNNEAKTVYTTADAPTSRTDNTVMVLTGNNASTAPTSLTSTAHVLTPSADGSSYSTPSFTLTDKADFYTPRDFTAETVTYSRTNTAGYNSVCLPFATTTTDYGTDSKIYSTGSVASDNSYIYIEEQTAAKAGQPVLVYCPDDVTTWSITKENAAVTASPVENAGAAATLLGSFTNKTIGAGLYKLNGAGTAFGITTSAGKVTAFRSYMKLNGDSQTSRLAVRIGDTPTSINGASTPTTDTDAWYDLQGRRVARPTTGIYLHGGRKVIVR